MLRRATLSLTVLAAAGCSLFSPGVHEDVGTIATTVSAKGCRILEVEGGTGRVNIVPSRNEEAKARVLVKYRGGRAALEREAGPEDFRLEVSGDRILARNLHANSDDRGDWIFECDLEVPAALDVEARLETGTLHLRGIEGDLALRVTTGRIQVEARSPRRIETLVTTGEVKITLQGQVPQGGIRAEATTGTLEISLPSGFDADCHLEAATGSVTVWGARALTPVVLGSYASATGRVGAGGPRIQAKVVTGHVRLLAH